MELEEFDPKKKYMPRVALLNDERSSLYISALLVSIIQFSVIMLIVFYFNDGTGVQLVPAMSLLDLLPRLISCIMMHLNVLPDLRQGIELMKFAVNHPHKFRPLKNNFDVEVESLMSKAINSVAEETKAEKKKKYEDETADEISYKGTVGRAFCAFMLGFIQASIALIAECIVIYYLSSLTDLLKIIMKYVSLAAVTKFDNMYAAALHNHAIMGTVGCKLHVSNKRADRFAKARVASGNADYHEADSEQATSRVLNSQEQKVEEVKNSCFVKLLRFVEKVYRTFFISVCYYFMPLTALGLSFFINQKK